VNKFWFTTLALAAVLAVAPFAKADSYYLTVSAAGPNGTVTGSGTISVNGGGLITDANFNFNDGSTGSLITSPFSGVLTYDVLYLNPPSPHTMGFTTTLPGNSTDYIGFDNLLSSTTIFDWNGILLQLSNGGVLNFFCDGNGAYWDEWVNGNWVTASTTPSAGRTDDIILSADLGITPAPEPSSMLLLSSGLLGLAGFLFWKVKTGSTQSA